MKTSFSEYLSNAFINAQYDLCMQNRETDEKRRSAQTEYNKTFENIRNRLGEHRKLMLKLERLQNEIESIDDDFIYLQGFIDCVTLLKTIRLI